MAIKTFEFNFDCYEAEAVFKVDTDIFTKEIAQETLDFFSWNYNKGNDPITEVLKKYAMESIKLATHYSFNVNGVISEFRDKEGFANIDGSMGLTLVRVEGFEFDYDKLDYEIK
jgi:maleate cis-trans isomerase